MMDELHYRERPIALQTQLIAAVNRDRKKQKRPQPIDEFFMYRRQEMSNLPAAIYGAAMKKLIELGLLPSWTLFCYRDVVQHAGEYAPEPYALIHQDAVLLAPRACEEGLEGLLIAKEAASNRVLEMRDTDGVYVAVRMPHISTKFVAQEDVRLQLMK